MKTIISKTDLRNAINRVLPAVAVKPSTPVLAGVHLIAENNSLTIRATNFELDITAKIPANTEISGECVVTGRHFGSIVSKLGGDIVTLEESSAQLKIKSEAASFDILTMNPEAFPAAPELDAPATFRLNKFALKETIRRTAFACGRDTSRPIYTGVNFNLNGRNLTAVGTNTHRIAISKVEIFDEVSANAIVPATALNALQSALGEGMVITAAFDPRRAAFEFDNIKLITRLIDGNFPPINRIIPESCKTTAEIDRKELAAAIDRVQVIRDDYNTLNLTFTSDGLEISAHSDSIGRARENVDATVTGADISLAVNSQYLTDVLKIFEGKTVEIGCNEPLTPVLVTDGEDGFTYVVTPLRTQ